MKAIDYNKVQEIIHLRSRGHSIPEISMKLILPKSTVCKYVKGVEVMPAYRQRLEDRRNASKIISERAKSVAKIKAEDLIDNLSIKDLALIGASLYWAEGNKKDFCFTNTDPQMVSVFLASIRKVFNVSDSDIKVSIRVYEDLDVAKCVNFWSEVMGFSLQENVKINLLKGFKKGKLEYGMCRMRVKKASLLHKTIFAINKRVGELITPHSSTDRTRHS